MKLRDIFRHVRAGDAHQVNNEYVRIRQEYDDMAVGTHMMQNDLHRNIELWAAIEQAVMLLFQYIERSSMLKQGIIDHLHLSTGTPAQPVTLSPHLSHSAKNLLEIKALSFYRKAYSSAVTGDTEAFKNYALDYRITSGLSNKELSELLQWVKDLSRYVELDEINIRNLWHIYQKGYPKDLEKLLYKALLNRIFQNETVCVETYIECVSAVNARLKKGV